MRPRGRPKQFDADFYFKCPRHVADAVKAVAVEEMTSIASVLRQATVLLLATKARAKSA